MFVQRVQLERVKCIQIYFPQVASPLPRMAFVHCIFNKFCPARMTQRSESSTEGKKGM